jgi:hypothetical protein
MSNPRSRHRTRATAALAVLAGLIAAAPAGAADGTFTQILCANPDTGNGLGVSTVDGLTAPATASSWRATITPATCATGPKASANAITLGPSSTATVPYNGYASLHYAVADPSLSLESARYFRAFASGNHPFEVQTRVAQHGASASSIGTPLNGFDSFWSGQSQSAGRADQPFASENEVDAVHDGRSFAITAQCRDTGGTCAHAAGEWSYRFFGGEVRLRDTEPPVIESLSGSLLDGGAVTTEHLTFRATDEGAGVYRFRATIDGAELAAEDLTPGSDVTATDRSATCFDVNPQNGDPYEFAHQQPCPASLERDVTIDTSSVADGPHRLRAIVEDAGGNETVLVDRQVVVDNHPAPELVDGSLPEVAGTPTVGEPLTGENGSWRGATTYDYYWERCPTETTCAALVDAPGRTYVPTADDVGARMRFLVIATNEVGEWTVSTSPYSAPVARAAEGSTPGGGSSAPTRPDTPSSPPGAPTPPEPGPTAHDAAAPTALVLNGRGATSDARLLVTSRRKIRTRFASANRVSGRLTDGGGQPIAGAVLQLTTRQSSAGAITAPLGTTVTGDDGGFSYTVPGGPSRRVDVAYRTSLGDDRPAASATVRLVVPAAVSLRIRAARPGRTTWMTGRLKHLPRRGVQIQVQALDGRRWRTFDTTTTRGGGRFRFGYRFKPAAAGRTFHLRVLVDSPIYPFARGASRAGRMRVPR